VHVLAGHVLEEREEIDFLLVVAAERRALLLPDDCDDRLVIGLGIVEPVQEMDCARPRGRKAHSDFASELRMRARHEGRELLVTSLHELDRIAAPEGADDAVDTVAGITEDTAHAPRGQALEKKIANSGSHEIAFERRSSRTAEAQARKACADSTRRAKKQRLRLLAL
jgi:hypothetical protein